MSETEVERVWGDFKALAEQVADTRRRAEAAEALVEQVRSLCRDESKIMRRWIDGSALVDVSDVMAILDRGAAEPMSKPSCGGCGATWPDLHVYHPGPGGTLCVKCGWTPEAAQ